MRTFYFIFILTGFFLIECNQSIAQKKPSNKNVKSDNKKNDHVDKKTIHLAREYFRVEEFDEAAKLYETLSQKYPQNMNYKYYLGVCYFKLGDKEKAIKYFSQCRKDSATGQVDFNYYIAKSFQLAHHFDDALQYYNIYRDTLSRTKTPEKFEHSVTEIDREIERCKNAIELMKHPQNVEIINFGKNVNSEFHEYMPVITIDETEMMFTSRRPTTLGGGKDPADGNWYEDIYLTTKTDSGWGVPKDMGAPVNTPTHDATVCLSADGQKLFIYKSQVERLSENFNGDIYVTELKDGIWTAPKKVEYNVNSDFWEPSGSISAAEDKFFFSSNRPRHNAPHRKDRDIYMVKKLPGGQWSQPKNLNFNSDAEEDAPFFHPDGRTLFFSSDGKGSVGGFDIFKTTYIDSTDTWTEPVNIGFPYNTSGDDIYIEWSADGKRAYFSSVRDDSYGGQDIYMAKSLTSKNSMAIMIGRVFDDETKKPLAAEVIVTDNEMNQVVGVFKSESKSGKFSLALPSGTNYGISINKDGYLFHSENIQIPHLAEFSEYKKDIFLHPFTAGSSEILKNVFFDTDKADLKQESKAELDKLYAAIKEKANVHVLISGHTDDKASHEYNQVLSEARAVAVVEYLVEKGIDKNKLFAKGYGEVQPIQSNETEEGRQMNRRIEFKILDTDSDENSKYINVKDTSIIRPGEERYAQLQENFKSLYLKEQANIAPVVGEYLNYQVHFPFNESKSLTDYSQGRLKAMLGYMQHFPKVKVVVVGHADFFGDDDMNAKLVNERSQTVYNFLITNGLNKSRIRLTTPAETKAIVAEDTKLGNVNNRKVEFLVESIK
jgi:outer membrane protein OmpA-like peptidoglycan-associated protein/tetratricopeptide (TPR) repeat protein